MMEIFKGKGFLKARQVIIISAGLIILGCLSLTSREKFVRSLEQMRKEYAIDRDLVSKKADRLNAYRKILEAHPQPKPPRLESAKWIQMVREKLEAYQIGLKEMRPIQSEDAGEGREGLSVTAESRFLPLFRFLYEMAESEEGTYVKRFLLSPATEDGELLELQMTIIESGGMKIHA